MGMHGEAWVNQAIQDPICSWPWAMRFDDRVTGNLKTYAVHAKKIHFELDPAEINKVVRVDLRLVGDVKDTLRSLLPRIADRQCKAWTDRITSLKGDSAVRDIQRLPHSGKLFAAHVMHDLWRITEGKSIRGDRRGPAPDVGGPVFTSTITRGSSSPRAAWAPWASRSPRPSAPASRARTMKYGSSRATADIPDSLVDDGDIHLMPLRRRGVTGRHLGSRRRPR